MKKHLLIASLCLMALGFCCCTSKKDEQTIDQTRQACIELNRKYNDIYQTAAYQGMMGDQEWGFVAYCIQQMCQELLQVNKALGIDCYQYNDDGSIMQMQHKDGNVYPCEIIPNELKLLNE